MKRVRASLDTIEDEIARMSLYNNSTVIRQFSWKIHNLPDEVRPGDEFEVTFENNGDSDSRVIDVSYSESMTEKKLNERRVPTAHNLVMRGASESRVRDFLKSKGISGTDMDRLIEKYFGEKYFGEKDDIEKQRRSSVSSNRER